ncbi:MAG: endolytic transglycosylase MltG, partial [Actinomycetes bacterium]
MTDLSVWTDEKRSTRRRRRRKKDRKSGLAVFLSTLLVLSLLAGAGLLVFGVGSKLKDVFDAGPAADYPGPGTGDVQVEVKPGQTLAAVGRTLKKEDVVASVEAFLEVANADPEASSSLQPGFYHLKRKMPAADALAALLDPASRVTSRVTLPEGLRLDETLKKLATESKFPLADYEKALQRAGDLGLPDYAGKNPEGFLFPATYDVQPDSTAVSIVREMFAAYDRAAGEAGVDRTNRTPYEIVVIASLIESEARHDEDFAKVARVVYNRLEKGMPLQFDSTVNYALKADKEIVTYEDLGEDSPYNTYKNTGLPPGPIGSP